MEDLLIQQGVHKALLGKAKKPEKISDKNWEEMDEKAASAIHLNLGDEVIHNILEAKTAEQIWKKLEGNDALSESWVLDSACSYHMCLKKEWFDTYKPYNSIVIMGNDATCSVIEIGTVKIKMFDGVVRVFEDVRHILDLRKTLISLGVLDDLGYSYSSKGGVMKITKGEVAVITPTKSSTDDTKFWHMRLGHINERGMLELHKRNLLKGMKTCKLDFCKYCGKQPRVSFKTGSHTSKGVLDYVHSHVWGPVSVSSHSGAHYFISFIDDYSRKVFWAEAVNTASFIINISPATNNDFNILQENEAKVYEDTLKEKSTIEVEFDEDNLPSDKDNDEDDSQHSGVPLSYKDATNKKYSDKWLVAMSKEIESLQKNINWESGKLPKKKKAIGYKWVYRKKTALSEEKCDISFLKIHINENASNMLTKPVPTDKFKHCLDLIGVRSL
uniref:Uncharacterized protein n=1 Tax=Fagus sylvatica TaxID=28930 RepID=A0A2N9J6E7_FAGSY